MNMEHLDHMGTKLDLSDFGEGDSSATTDPPQEPVKAKVKAKAKKAGHTSNAGVDVEGKQVWPTSKSMQRALHEVLLAKRKEESFPVDAPTWERLAVLIAHALETHPYWQIPAHILCAANDETSKTSGKYGPSENKVLKNLMRHKAEIEKKFGFLVYRDNGHVRALVPGGQDYVRFEGPRVSMRVDALADKAAEVERHVLKAGVALPEDVTRHFQKIVQVKTLLLGTGK